MIRNLIISYLETFKFVVKLLRLILSKELFNQNYLLKDKFCQKSTKAHFTWYLDEGYDNMFVNVYFINKNIASNNTKLLN